MSGTKDKNGTDKKEKGDQLDELNFILGKQVEADIKDTEEYMEDGFQSN